MKKSHRRARHISRCTTGNAEHEDDCTDLEIIPSEISGEQYATDRPNKKRRRESIDSFNAQNFDNVVISDCDIYDDRFNQSNPSHKRLKAVPIKKRSRVRSARTNSSRDVLVSDGREMRNNNDDFSDAKILKRKRTRQHDDCTGDEVIEGGIEDHNARAPFMKNEEETSTVTNDSDDGNRSDEDVIEIDRKVPFFATAIKQEDQSQEWMHCLQWLSHVGLGKHCDKLASHWEEDEIDFCTLKRLKNEHLVCICVTLSSLFAFTMSQSAEGMGNQKAR